jgi:hypothetical protein
MTSPYLPIGISVTGIFEAHELAELAEVLRRIDERHPDRLYSITIRGGPEADTTLDEAEELVRGMLPQVPGRKVVITVHKKPYA